MATIEKAQTVSQLLIEGLKANGVEAEYVDTHDSVEIHPSEGVVIYTGYASHAYGSVARVVPGTKDLEPDETDYPDTGLDGLTDDVEALIREWTRIALQYR